MTTPLDIIQQAMKKSGILGIGQTPNDEDTNDAFQDLNDMIAQWQHQRWLVYHLVDVAKVSTGAVSYTVGTGGDFNVPNPDRLEAAFLRQLVSGGNNVDYPLQLIESREIYNNIALKNLTSFSRMIFYDSGYPNGLVYPWPVPQADIYEIHITLKAQLGSFSSLVQQISLPSEYMAALKFNLAVRLKQAYQEEPDPVLDGLAKKSLEIIRGSNAQIPRLAMPTSLVRGGLYNIYSDTIY